MMKALLSVSNLRVEFPTRRGILVAVNDVSFDIMPGEVLGVGPAFSFEVDKQFDPLRAPVASIRCTA